MRVLMVEDDAFKNQNISFMSTLLCAEVEHINTGHGALAPLCQ